MLRGKRTGRNATPPRDRKRRDQAERVSLKTYAKPDAPGPLYSLVGLTDYLRATRR